jgi:PAS domain S-box-containing protein
MAKTTPQPQALPQPSSPPGTAAGEFLDALPDALIALDSAFRITGINAEALRRFGPVARVGGDFWNLFPDAVELARDTHYRRAMTERTSARFEHPHTQSGLSYTVRCSPLPAGMLVVFTDVSELKRAEASVLARENRYRLMFELSPQPMVMYDAETRLILMVNHAAGVLYRCPRESLVGTDVVNLAAESSRASVLRMLANLTASHGTRVTRTRHLRCDATEVEVEVTSHGFTADGRPIRVIQVVDITEQKVAGEKLRTSEELYRTLGEAMPVLTWAMSPQGVFEYVNQRFTTVTGMSNGDIVRSTGRELIHPDDLPRLLHQWETGQTTRMPVEAQVRLKVDGGDFRWHLARMAPLVAGDGTIARWLGVAADIDELKQTQSELRTAKEAAELANTRKDQFLALLSHELRTPLTPALLTASSIKDDPDLSPDFREAIHLICEQIELEAHLIDDLLDLTRITRGKFFLQPKPLDGRALVQKAVDAARPVVEAAGLNLVVDLKAETGAIVADPKRILQVLNNLLGNAAKFTPAGGTVTVTTSNRRRTSDQGPVDDLVTEVADTGVGIEPEILPHIFNAFEQGEQSITRKYGGLGLGLTIGRAIAEAHGGALSASSQGAGKGATLTLRLRLQPDATPEAAAPRADPKPDAGVSILLVDDHLPTLRMLSLLLGKLGHRVRAVASPADALEAAKQEKPDLLVSDIGMPGKSGWSLLADLRAAVAPDFPAIAVSGYGTDEDLKQSKAAGFADHLVKPIDADDLRAAISRVLQKR